MKNNRLFAVLSSIFLLTISLLSFGQVVNTVPDFPIATGSVDIIFNASEGNAGLQGFAGEVYAHTGVITNLSSSTSDWKYVKTGWGENTPETKLTSIGTDLWELEIGPSIREYYGVPDNEEILKLAFVFRSGEEVNGAWVEGKDEGNADIFVDVYSSGLSINIIEPELDEIMVQQNDIVPIYAASPTAEQMKVIIDGEELYSTDGNTLSYDFTVPETSAFWTDKYAIIEAIKGTESVRDSFIYMVLPAPEVVDLPQGLKNGINYHADDPGKVSLVLLAPHKERVFVLGDFNNWTINEDYYMNITPNGEQFWIEIDGLTAGKEYIFQYQIDDDLRIADPFADKISDPWNDKYISNTTYPNLIDYPTGKTEYIASVLQTAQEDYIWEIENFEVSNQDRMVIYELLIRDFTKQHSYNSLIDTLGYLERLGVNVIELMPINEFEGNESWGYNPSFYFAPDKYYGPKNTLKQFIDECHKRGIAVVIDMVLNHAYGQCPLVRMYWNSAANQPAADNPWFNEESPNPDYSWGSDFDHESPYTQAFVDSVNHYWISEYKVDGYRFDFTKGFTNTPGPGHSYDAARIEILKRMTTKIHEFKPDALVILEHLADNSEEKILSNNGMLLWGNLNHNYAEASMSWLAESNFDWISYQKRGWDNPAVVGYMESHDEERIMYKDITYGNENGSYNIQDTSIALTRQELTANFFLTIPGPKMIWQFGELGYDYSIEFNGRVGNKPIRWDYYNDYRRQYLYRVYSALIGLRNKYPVFGTSDYQLSLSGAIKKIHLYSDDLVVVVVGNFDIESASAQPIFPNTGDWFEFFTGQTINVTDENMSIDLKAGEYRLYFSNVVERPEWLNTAIDDFTESNNGLFALAYPSPASNQLTFSFGMPTEAHASIKIYNMQGQLVDVVFDQTLSTGTYTYEWDIPAEKFTSGQYIYILETDKNRFSGKLIIQ